MFALRTGCAASSLPPLSLQPAGPRQASLSPSPHLFAATFIPNPRPVSLMPDTHAPPSPRMKTKNSDLADYLVTALNLESRSEAVAIGQRWMDAGVFYHVTRSELFYDGAGLYRFKEDEVGAAWGWRPLCLLAASPQRSPVPLPPPPPRCLLRDPARAFSLYGA